MLILSAFKAISEPSLFAFVKIDAVISLPVLPFFTVAMIVFSTLPGPTLWLITLISEITVLNVFSHTSISFATTSGSSNALSSELNFLSPRIVAFSLAGKPLLK